VILSLPDRTLDVVVAGTSPAAASPRPSAIAAVAKHDMGRATRFGRLFSRSVAMTKSRASAAGVALDRKKRRKLLKRLDSGSKMASRETITIARGRHD